MPERLECEVLQKARYINTLIIIIIIINRRSHTSCQLVQHSITLNNLQRP